MALLKYLQPRNRPSNPKRLLFSSLPSQAIAEVNWLVLEAVHNDKKKQGTYHQYLPAVRLEIAKYALINRCGSHERRAFPYSFMFPTREIYFRGDKCL